MPDENSKNKPPEPEDASKTNSGVDISLNDNHSQLDESGKKESKTTRVVDANDSQLQQTSKMSLESQIEAVLFWKGEPMTVKELTKFFDVKKEELETALTQLETSLKTGNRGLSLVRNGTGGAAGSEEVMLYTAPEASELIKRLAKEELSRDVSKAGVEVLSLILYRGPIAKREIDYIRGVNSGYIIRNLMVRGLIERADTKDARSFIYQPTFDLLSQLGVSRKEDLPDFTQVQKDIEAFVAKEEGLEISASGAVADANQSTDETQTDGQQ